MPPSHRHKKQAMFGKPAWPARIDNLSSSVVMRAERHNNSLCVSVSDVETSS
jgi:hypothetical protein